MTPTMSLPLEHSWLQSLSALNQISPFETFQSGTEGLARNTLGSHIALTVRVRLLGVDDPYLRKNIILGILVLIKTGPVP